MTLGWEEITAHLGLMEHWMYYQVSHGEPCSIHVPQSW